jgi:hypothetical protein
VTSLFAVLGLGACGAGEGDSYILLDEPARAALVEVEAGGRHHTGALPLEVQAGDRVELITPAGRRRITIDTGRLYEVSVTVVQVSRLGQDRRTDLVDVIGPDPTVHNLASALGAQAQPWNGRWRLAGPDAFVRLAWMGDIADVGEVLAVPTEAARAAELASLASEAPRLARLTTTADPLLPDVVGAYALRSEGDDAGQSLFLDAEGGFSIQRGCGHSPLVGAYHLDRDRVVLAGALDGADLTLRRTPAGGLAGATLEFSPGGDR